LSRSAMKVTSQVMHPATNTAGEHASTTTPSNTTIKSRPSPQLRHFYTLNFHRKCSTPSLILRNSGSEFLRAPETMTHDAENPHDERTPLLDEHNYSTKSKEARSSLPKVVNFFMGGIYAPDASTHDPIEILLNSDDLKERDQLTEKWRDNRLNELGFVGVVAALLAGVLTSTGSWPDILPNGQQSPWPIRTSWYCGIILSLFSLLTAADQTVRLYRLSSHRDGNRSLRRLLADSKSVRDGSRLRPSRSQLYAWQMPVMFLTTATICMIAGMFLHVWSATRHLEHQELWNSDFKVRRVHANLPKITDQSVSGGHNVYHCCCLIHCSLLRWSNLAICPRYHR
jgi:hypothetical protein